MSFVIIFIILIIIVLFIELYPKSQAVEGFNPWLDYSRAYPGTFSYKYGYGPFFRPFYNSWPGTSSYGYGRFNSVWPGNVRYNPGYSDYWYIPAHEYLNNWMNGDAGLDVPNGCIVPPSTSEYCVHKKVQETGNLDQSIAECTVPPTISGSCPSLRNWQGPLTYYDNDYINTSQIVA